jgi:hypothetical protein
MTVNTNLDGRWMDTRSPLFVLKNRLPPDVRLIVQLLAFLLLQFLSQRGDGFPLAAMLAAIAVENKDLVPVLTAHILYVCESESCRCWLLFAAIGSLFYNAFSFWHLFCWFCFIFSTVCPTAIPKLPTPSADATEEELMESLGMIKGKNGEFETFERFLSRTEVCLFCSLLL